jgi:polyhydroxybutyrate depolymerase
MGGGAGKSNPRQTAMTSARLVLVTASILLSIGAQSMAEEMLYRTLQHDGLNREYFVHVPAGADERSPLVLVLHGYTSTATGFATMHDLSRHADDNGYIVVYPQGTYFMDEDDNGEPYRVTSWNLFGDAVPLPDAGPQCIEDAQRYPCPPECGDCDRCAWPSCNNDIEFFDRLFEALEAEFAFDENRVYMFGESNGGMMMFRLACDRSKRFAAVASLIAQMPAGYACSPSTDLPMLLRYGGADEVVRHDGTPGASDGFIYTSVAETTSVWADALQCRAGPAPWQNEHVESAGLSCSAYSDCRVPGHKVVSCINPGATHEWAEQKYDGWTARCVTSQQLALMPGQIPCPSLPDKRSTKGIDVIWGFLSRYRRN